MGKKKSIGLPGGPNEFLQDITQYISVEGYKRTSSDINNPVNIIESGSITMKDVDFPVYGIDNLNDYYDVNLKKSRLRLQVPLYLVKQM